MVCYRVVLSGLYWVDPPFAAGRKDPAAPKSLCYFQLRLCQLPAVEYPGNLVGDPGSICGCHLYNYRKFTGTVPRFLAGKPNPNDSENPPAVPSFGNLDGVRTFSSVLGPGLALAKPGECTGHRPRNHPMV